MASASDDGTVKLWEVAGGQELRTLKGHTGSVFSVSFSPNGRTLVSGGDDGAVKLWDPLTGRLLWTADAPQGNSVFFSPNGRTVVSGSDDGAVRLWNSTTGALLKTMNSPNGKMREVALTSDGRELISDNGTMAIRDMAWT
jgi:WD40 repeat protein